jgi:diguanylate cyclase (GGDEF)-like protein
VPVALLIGILVASVVVNVALIVIVVRADDFVLRLPRSLRPLVDLLRSDPAAPDPVRPRRRTLYVAEHQPRPTLSGPPPVRVVPAPGAGGPAAAASRPMTETLPAELAEFLSRPAEIALSPEEAARREGRLDRLVVGRWPRLPAGERLARDVLTGLEGPASWSRILEVENARLLRYRRPVTIVMAEIEGLARLTERLGAEPVGRLLPVVADALVREARSSDWIARIGEGRFAVLLPETDEIQAINYVERVRAVCEPWLASAAVQLRLAIGWSSPTPSSDLELAIRRAEERMNADRRAPARAVSPARAVPAAFVTVASGAGSGQGRAAEPGPAAVEEASPGTPEPPGAEPRAPARARRKQRTPPQG